MVRAGVASSTPKKSIISASQHEERFALQVRAYRLPEPDREFAFHGTRKWRFDFAWPDYMLAVEIEGGVAKSRHTSIRGFSEDCHKYNSAAMRGWTLLRFTGAMVKNGTAINLVDEHIKRFE